MRVGPASGQPPSPPGGHTAPPDPGSRLAPLSDLGRQQRAAGRRLCRPAGRDDTPRVAWSEVWVLFRRAHGAPGAEPEIKIYLSNAPEDTPLAELVRVSGMRWPIESCFEEGKSEVGLDQYELRSWPGWHHHMTLVILAHHFLVRMQQRLNQRGGACGVGGSPRAARLPGPAGGGLRPASRPSR